MVRPSVRVRVPLSFTNWDIHDIGTYLQNKKLKKLEKLEKLERLKRVVIIGLSGIGKTSLFNMLCGTPVPTDVHPCTSEEPEALCNLIDGRTCTVRDTCGLPEVGPGSFIPDLFRKSTTKELQKNLKKLREERELHLLIYCMSAHSRNKKNSHEKYYKMLTSIGVPVVVVVTNLEREDISTESWWLANKELLEKLGMNSSTGHECVTTLPIRYLTEKERPLHYVSCTKVKALISSNIL